MMNLEADQIANAIPGVLVVAFLAFPALCLLRWHFVIRLILAVLTVLGGLGLFAQMLRHRFEFLRPQDLPILAAGVMLAVVVAGVLRQAKKMLFGSREAAGRY